MHPRMKGLLTQLQHMHQHSGLLHVHTEQWCSFLRQQSLSQLL